MRSFARRSLLPLVILASGCGGPRPRVEPARPAAAMPPLVAPASSEATSAPAASGAYELHEWGVVDVTAEGAFEVGAGPGPASPDVPHPVRKPVLYFHLDGTAPLVVEVTATLPFGTILEHWPPAEATNDRVIWPRVVLDPSACPTDAVRENTRRGACRTPDGVCEVDELGAYVTRDATCLVAGSTRARLLFYRGATRRDPLPASVQTFRDHVMVAGRGASATRTQGIGPVIRLVRLGPDDVRIARGNVPTPSAATALPTPTERVVPARERDALRELARLHGLTEDEAAAFVAAWAPSLFESTGTDPDLVLYFLPDDEVGAIAQLGLRPEPRVVRRAMMVRTLVPPWREPPPPERPSWPSPRPE